MNVSDIVKKRLLGRGPISHNEPVIWKWVTSQTVAIELGVSTAKARKLLDKSARDGLLVKAEYKPGCYASYTIQIEGYKQSKYNDYIEKIEE